MALSVDKLLTDAHMLITRLKGHDSLADGIIGNSQALFNKVEAMKQYQDDITELNEIAKHRPRSTLVLGIAQENRQIRQLQQENRELEASLEEHQSALELIMQKYREHTVKLLQTNQIERALKEKESAEKNSMCHLMDKIDEMAGVMQKAIEVDETSGCVDKERLRCMEVENKALREMLEICSTSRERIVPLESELTPIKMLDELLEEKSEGAEAEEESDSEADTSTLKRFRDKDDDDSDDVDSSTLKRSDSASSTSSSKDKEEPKKEEKKEAAADSKKKTEAKKPDSLGKDGASRKENASNRNGSKSPVSSKSTGDIKKSRVSSSPVKRTSSSSATNKKESPSPSSSSLKKTTSLDSKKDAKSKAPAKSGSKK